MSPTAIEVVTPTAEPKRREAGKNGTPLEIMSHGPLALTGIPNFTSQEGKRRWQLEHMAGAFRIFGRHGYAEGMAGHISVRDPILPNAFWINPLGVHFSLLRASDMMLLDMDTGEVLIGGATGRPANATGYLIHRAVHMARPDVHAVCHAHPPHGRAWSSFARPLEMLNQDVCNLFGAQAVYAEYGGLAVGGDEGMKIAKALGQNKACILMNHGLLTVGTTVDEAAYLFRLMENSCQVQLLAEAAAANGLQKKIISDEEALNNFNLTSEAVSLAQVHLFSIAFSTNDRTICIASFNPNTSWKCAFQAVISSTEMLGGQKSDVEDDVLDRRMKIDDFAPFWFHFAIVQQQRL